MYVYCSGRCEKQCAHHKTSLSRLSPISAINNHRLTQEVYCVQLFVSGPTQQCSMYYVKKYPLTPPSLLPSTPCSSTLPTNKHILIHLTCLIRSHLLLRRLTSPAPPRSKHLLRARLQQRHGGRIVRLHVEIARPQRSPLAPLFNPIPVIQRLVARVFKSSPTPPSAIATAAETPSTPTPTPAIATASITTTATAAVSTASGGAAAAPTPVRCGLRIGRVQSGTGGGVIISNLLKFFCFLSVPFSPFLS